jgi:Glucosamine-6-phosphate isomerases/6-phosphogluconolactonase
MVIKCFSDKREMANVAAEQAAAELRGVIDKRGKARIVAATGAAQFEFLEALTSLPGIDWTRVEMFHLDEYIGLPASHPASFCRFLKERLIQKTWNYKAFSARWRTRPGRGHSPHWRGTPGCVRRSCVRGYRGERPPGIQRSSRRL